MEVSNTKTPKTILIIVFALLIFFVLISAAYLIAFSGNPDEEDSLNITITNKTAQPIEIIINRRWKERLNSGKSFNFEATRGSKISVEGYINPKDVTEANIEIANGNYRGKGQIYLNGGIYHVSEMRTPEKNIDKYNVKRGNGLFASITENCGKNNETYNFMNCKNLKSYVINFFEPLK